MRAAPYLAAILALIAFQMAFGIYVRAATGSHLAPVIYDSLRSAFGMGVAVICLGPVIAAKRIDRARVLPSFVENLKSIAPNFLCALVALILLSLSLAMMNWTKSMIPAFTADHLLADLDRAVFGTDPAQLFRIPFVDQVLAFAYGIWMPLMFASLTFAAYNQQYRAVVSLVLIIAIDTVVQFSLPSAGPIFWQRLGYGDRFAYLADEPSTYQIISNLLWTHYEAGTLVVGSGISAFPSMHVALSAWMALSFPKARIVFVPFLLLVFAGSLASGWHYFSDGVAGCLMAYAAHRMVMPRKTEDLSPQAA